MKLNQNHPDCAQYREKWDAIVAEWERVSAETESQNKGFRGLDGPVAAVDKKYMVKLSALQKEYKHLYE